ncbi:unnamed protein product [Rhodiola kirilowii]
MASTVSSFFIIVLFCLPLVGYGQLDANYYTKTCPQVQKIVASGLEKVFKADSRMAASLLKLHFSDCFVNGCDASVLLDDKKDSRGEKNAIPNFKSARGYEIIDSIKSEVEKSCPSIVSCADILTLAAKEAVIISGGPSWAIPLGRRDGVSASDKAANQQLPVPSESLVTTYNRFKSKGLNVTDAVLLSASHSIGFARCKTFKNRLFNYKNSGKPDSKLNPKLLKQLQTACPDASSDDKPCDLTPSSGPKAFGLSYYNNLLSNSSVLESDIAIMTDRLAASLVVEYSKNQKKFFKDFVVSMIKLGNVGVITAPNGQIRKKCGSIN